ncbi:MAG TPA: serine/threonine-protein kinase [Polyangia bacterium]
MQDAAEDTNVDAPEAPTVAAKHVERISTVTPDVALLTEELARMRVFLGVCAVLAGVLMICAPLLSGPPWQRFGVCGACFVVVAASLWFRLTIRDATQYTETRLLVVAYLLMVATGCGVYFVGVFSPAPMAGTLGIYFLSLGSSRIAALSSYIMGSLMHGIPAVLIAAGVIADPGLFSDFGATPRDKLLVALLVQVVFFLTFVLARLSRRATRELIEKLHAALAQVQKREALLVEAHHELDRALVAGRPGRYSERQLGPFRLGPVIGRGAMSEIYRAARIDDGRPAAVKVLHRDLLSSEQHRRRFQREAEIIASLRSRHTVRLYTVGMDATGDAPAFIAMELLEGHDLAWELRRERRLSPERVMSLVDQVADALTEAAAAEIVHRDLKPQNIFAVTTNGGEPTVWKVLDFGVSKLENSGTLTHGHVVGTPGYMAPEQARGGDVAPSADVFALAVIAYRALTGRPAFSGRELPRVLFDVCYVQPMQPSKLVQMPDDVERVLALGMAKDASERLATANELAAGLHAAFEGGLDGAFRRRADALLAREPWGAKITS